MNPDDSIPTAGTFLNRYFLLRHGESRALQEGLIVGELSHGKSAYGLTPKGRKEVATSILKAMEDGLLKKVDLVISSPFLRTVETAEIAAKIIGAPIEIDDRLGERGFGKLELTSIDNYAAVLDRDRASASHKEWGVESALEVLARAWKVIEDLEGKMKGCGIVLCTHADVMSILICGCLHQNLELHAEIGPLATAELRELVLRRSESVV